MTKKKSKHKSATSSSSSTVVKKKKKKKSEKKKSDKKKGKSVKEKVAKKSDNNTHKDGETKREFGAAGMSTDTPLTADEIERLEGDALRAIGDKVQGEREAEEAARDATKAPKPVLRWDSLVLSRHDLGCLDNGSLLNDSVMDFFLRLIHRCLVPRADVHVFSSHFFTRLMAGGAADGEKGWENVKSWTRRAGLFTHRYAIVPVNSDVHWWLALVRLRDYNDRLAPSLVWIDSLTDSDRYDEAASYLRGYLRREWSEISNVPGSDDREGTLPLGAAWEGSTMEAGICEPVPQQTNGVDCGVFMIENVLRLFAGADVRLGRTGNTNAVWCDQELATRRRATLQQSVQKMEWACGCGGSSGRRVSVTDLLAQRPQLAAWLRELWGLAPTCSAPEACLRDGLYAYDEAGRAPGREGELAGEVEAGCLKDGEGRLPFAPLAAGKFMVTRSREQVVRVEGDRLFWDDGDVWKWLEDDVASVSSSSLSDSGTAMNKKKKRKHS